MSAKTYIDINGNEVAFIVTSAGIDDAGKGVGLGVDGKLDASVMPVSVGPTVVSVQAVGAITAGSFVNIYNVAGAARMRLADATDNTKPAHGFVQADVANGASGNVYGIGSINTHLSALTVGTIYYLSKITPGSFTTDVSAYSGGNIIQPLGPAVSTTQLIFGTPAFKTTV